MVNRIYIINFIVKKYCQENMIFNFQNKVLFGYHESLTLIYKDLIRENIKIKIKKPKY